MSKFYWASMKGQVGAIGRPFADYWAPMNGLVGATCRHLALSGTSGIYRSWEIDEWKSQCNLPASGSKLHIRRVPVSNIRFTGHRAMEKSAPLASLRRQAAPPTFTDIGGWETNPPTSPERRACGKSLNPSSLPSSQQPAASSQPASQPNL